MILPPKSSSAHLVSAWTAGVASLFLAVGIGGAITPLVPEIQVETPKIDLGDNVMVEEFSAASAPAAEVPEFQPQEEQVEEVEIPPLPDIAPPLTPPEMVELTTLEPIVERPPAPPPPEPKPKATPRRASPQPRSTGSSPNGTGTGGGGGAPVLFTGAGGGNFPSPYYPASARTANKQGTVRLLVTVEANGVPSSVSVSGSSGHSILDSAARDHVQRRWRWPSGPIRRYIVPVRFVLQ